MGNKASTHKLLGMMLDRPVTGRGGSGADKEEADAIEGLPEGLRLYALLKVLNRSKPTILGENMQAGVNTILHSPPALFVSQFPSDALVLKS